MKQIKLLGLIVASFTGLQGMAQQVPPLLFTEMDGFHVLSDGTFLPIWGYGWVADGFITLPGPLLEYSEGDDVSVTFINPSPESHTIHWHGLDVDQAADGVPSTSFQVTTGNTGTYEFSTDYAGTFLYHCHVTTTLHLTMGMYGMLLVTRPDMTLFEGGPEYDADVPLFFSDLEIATNLNPTASFPFHDIRPDVFMVNGSADWQLELPENVVNFEPGQTLALRLGSMAYSRVHCTFPPELHAVCQMSDGRPVPPFELGELEVFPGERFTVLITPDAGWSGVIEAEFWNMPDHFVEDVQEIWVQDVALGGSDIFQEALRGYPNPANDVITYPAAESVFVWDAWGREVFSGALPDGILRVSDWPIGTYIFRQGTGPTSRFEVVH